jgi:hypothetical protein
MCLSFQVGHFLSPWTPHSGSLELGFQGRNLLVGSSRLSLIVSPREECVYQLFE